MRPDNNCKSYDLNWEHDDVIDWKHVFFNRHLNQQLNQQAEAGNFRRHRAHYEVIVMTFAISSLGALTKWILAIEKRLWNSFLYPEYSYTSVSKYRKHWYAHSGF